MRLNTFASAVNSPVEIRICRVSVVLGWRFQMLVLMLYVWCTQLAKETTFWTNLLPRASLILFAWPADSQKFLDEGNLLLGWLEFLNYSGLLGNSICLIGVSTFWRFYFWSALVTARDGTFMPKTCCSIRVSPVGRGLISATEASTYFWCLVHVQRFSSFHFVFTLRIDQLLLFRHSEAHWAFWITTCAALLLPHNIVALVETPMAGLA